MSNIVYLGAPETSELQRALSANANRVIVLEALPSAAENLKKQQQASANLELIEVSVSASGARKLHEYSLHGLASLHRPDRLKQLYPGLKVKAEHWVNILPPAELINRLELNVDEENTLIYINAPGEERLLVQQLLEHGILQHFKAVGIVHYKPGMYEDDHADIDLEKLLQSEGYRVEVSPRSDAISEYLHGRVDVRQRRIKKLETKLSEKDVSIKQLEEGLNKERDQYCHALDELKKKLDAEIKRKQELERTESALQETIDQQRKSNSELKSKVEVLTSEVKELGGTKEQLKAELDKALKDDEEKEAQVERLEDNLKSERERSHETLEELKKKADYDSQQWQELQQRNASLQEKVEQLSKTSEELKTNLENANSDKDKFESELNTLRAEKQTLEKKAAELDSVKQELDAVKRERANLNNKLATEQKALAQAQSIIEDLKQQLKAQNAENEQQIEAEFIKAESQLELIKDILIREKLF